MSQIQEELVKEEQIVLDELICNMDQTLMKLDKRLTYAELQAKKARESCLPDTYGMLVSAEYDKREARRQKRELSTGKDMLYEIRLNLDITDERGHDCEDVKIGLHTYTHGSEIFIMSWTMPLCRHYMLDNSTEEYDSVVKGKLGEKYNTHYQLRLKRKMTISFDKVKSVTHLFPATYEETEQIIADEFLQELLKRRTEQEFKNIVFSIQKKQGAIIQTPFKQNLIVQGCAGSGKSMIMLHRLPIVIYDNPNSLDRNNLYIITPSIAYIRMADNMRRDLEIEDLKMGTLEQYYNDALWKYRVKSDVYGLKPYIKLNEADLNYVYSLACVNDIKNEIEKIIKEGDVDYKTGYELFNLTEQINTKAVITPADRIRARIVKIQNVLNANNNSLRTYRQNVFELFKQLEEFARMLENRKIAINRKLSQSMEKEKNAIIENKKTLENFINIEEPDVEYQNCLNSIKFAEQKIVDLEETQEIVNLDDRYFEELKNIAKIIRKIISLFSVKQKEQIELTLDEQYQIVSNKELICVGCSEVLKSIEYIGDPYSDYIYSIESAWEKLKPCLMRLIDNHNVYLSREYLKMLFDAKAYLSDAAEKTVHKIYLFIMKKLGQEEDEKGRLEALECSPYLYLQILFLFNGVPNVAKESLITIDEAQNIAPEELKLIKAVNGNDVILNLFGDVKQHVEGSKGIDDWKEILDIANFKKEYMQENYRNARQITAYCNKRFGLDMRAINLDGMGVHECKSKEFEAFLVEIFQKPQNVGLSCFIVKNKVEAESLLVRAGDFKTRIYNMTGGFIELQKNKWNLMTVEQAKGLEFETVFAISGRMSENEKYIAYTRALDELYVYDEELELIEIYVDDDLELKIENKSQENNTRKKRVKRNSKVLHIDENVSDLKQFFEAKGLNVIDDRKKSGYLWVLGSKNEIDSIVIEAIDIYGITGSYGNGKVSGFREGWFTKSKK